MQTSFVHFEVPAEKPSPRPPCVENGCNLKNVALGCGHRRCKKHCLLQAAPCGQPGHDKARRAGTLTAIQQPHDPFNLAHPPPVIPPAPQAVNTLPTPPSTHPSAVGTPDPAPSQPVSSRDFRVPMPEVFKKDWDTRTQAQRAKRQAEEDRRKHLALLNQEYTVNIWVKSGEPPEAHTLQGSPTWPTFTLAALTDILAPLSLSPLAGIEIYHIPSRTWRRQQVQTVMKINNKVNLLFRLLGVTECPGLDAFCIQAGQRTLTILPPQRTAQGYPSSPPGPSSLPSSSSLGSSGPSVASLASRASMMSLVSATSAMSITPGDTLDSPASAQAVDPVLLADCALPEPSPRPPHDALGPSSDLVADTPRMHAGDEEPNTAALSDAELDALYLSGYVFTPLHKKSWPAGMYARDMARAFALLSDTDDDKKLRGRFEQVFPGRPFKPATYHSQRFAWVHSPEEQRRWIMELPRTEDGLWSKCRKKLHGWKMLPAHQ